MAVRSEEAKAYERAKPPSPSTPWREAGYAVVDLELTGTRPEQDEIVSFAAVPIDGDRVVMNEAVYHVVRPDHMPNPGTVRIHGLRERDLEYAPPLDEVIGELLAALTGRALVAHVATIEESFLREAFESRGLRLRAPIIDTARLGAELRRMRGEPALESAKDEPATASLPGLSRLARSLGMPVHRPHTADGDALTTAQVFLALATHLDEIHSQTVGSLQALSGDPAGRRRLRPRLRP